MTFIFKSIPPVLQHTELIDTSLNKTQRQTPTMIHKTTPLPQIRRFYSTKIKTAASNFTSHLSSILTSFPHIDNLHPFHSTLLSHFYNKDTYKIHLSHISTTISYINKTASHFLSLINHTTTLFQSKTLKKAALGKMANHIKKLKNTLQYLETIRQHMSRLPQINPTTRTILLIGHPNTGKSSFLNTLINISGKNDEYKNIAAVHSYPFTTQNLTLAHFVYNTLSFQLLDTPGLINSTEKNSIELQTVIALLHLKSVVLFFIDLSESCGYLVEDQILLYKNVESLIGNNVIIVLSKNDLEECKKYENNVFKEFIENKKYISISTVSQQNIEEIKKMACEMLVSSRIEEKKEILEKSSNRLIMKGNSKKEKSLCCLKKEGEIKEEIETVDVVIPEFLQGKNFTDFIDRHEEALNYLKNGDFDVIRREYDLLSFEEKEMLKDIFNEKKKRIILHLEKSRSKLPEKWKNIPNNSENIDERIEDDSNTRNNGTDVLDIVRDNNKENKTGEKLRKENEYRMKHHTSSKAKHLYR
ncbi:nucleolar GTP-binding protein 1 [Hamiltosporidium tvaerminnensis]|uniref:Nucleolar GTP-binding protein 1 n=2 Tax=Hamiltosporidium TaxID=1176354 RepID=A0A4Q9L0L5_9MICR|nr:hypothetical protein LUQ84_002089 [Hamiltosporidium tvaerminnensis]TBT99395.1 nucleolar GTP-binding protein 1 [Hamiltosporidium tvaerminnensis]TBU00879.1 nucleolar GTP-binding protein 1 [Hamiltosporidium magnivora]